MIEKPCNVQQSLYSFWQLPMMHLFLCHASVVLCFVLKPLAASLHGSLQRDLSAHVPMQLAWVSGNFLSEMTGEKELYWGAVYSPRYRSRGPFKGAW